MRTHSRTASHAITHPRGPYTLVKGANARSGGLSAPNAYPGVAGGGEGHNPGRWDRRAGVGGSAVGERGAKCRELERGRGPDSGVGSRVSGLGTWEWHLPSLTGELDLTALQQGVRVGVRHLRQEVDGRLARGADEVHEMLLVRLPALLLRPAHGVSGRTGAGKSKLK